MNSDEYGVVFYIYNFTQIMSMLGSLLEKDDISISSDTISAYDLHNIMLQKLEKLNSISNSDFFKKINDNNTISLNSFSFNRFRAKFKYIFQHKLDEKQNKVNSIVKPILSVCSKDDPYYYLDDESHGKINIYKSDNGLNYSIIVGPNYYSITENLGYFKEKFSSQIFDVLTTMEEFGSLFQGEIRPGTNDDITKHSQYDIIDFVFRYNGYGKVTSSICLGGAAAIFERHLSRNERNKIDKYLSKNKEEILRKIPIKVSELDSVTKGIVEDALHQQMLPQYTKKKRKRR